MSVAQRMDQAVNSIVDALMSRLEDERSEGGSLEGVESLVRGDRALANVSTPSVWIWPETATAATDMGLAETWNMPVVLAALVQDVEDIERGFREATRLAGVALQLALDGNPRLDELSWVDDITSLRFEPSGPRNTNDRRTLFWADAVVNIRFRRRQPNG